MLCLTSCEKDSKPEPPQPEEIIKWEIYPGHMMQVTPSGKLTCYDKKGSGNAVVGIIINDAIMLMLDTKRNIQYGGWPVSSAEELWQDINTINQTRNGLELQDAIYKDLKSKGVTDLPLLEWAIGYAPSALPSLKGKCWIPTILEWQAIQPVVFPTSNSSITVNGAALLQTQVYWALNIYESSSWLWVCTSPGGRLFFGRDGVANAALVAKIPDKESKTKH